MAARLRSVALEGKDPRYTSKTQDTMDFVPRLRLVPMPERPHGSDEERRKQYLAVDSLELVARILVGDELAIDVLGERYANLFRRWVRMRLSAPDARGETNLGEHEVVERVVRDATTSTMKQLSHRGITRQGTLLLNLRDAACARLRTSKSEEDALDATIGRPTANNYERSLLRLEPAEREAIVCVLEFQRGFEQLRDDLGTESVESARVTYARAVVRLAEEMGHGR